MNVSDKAVSRWERDECAPDITLIPVIADIFDVTSDEILRGERSNNENGSSSSDDKTKNEEKKSRLQLSNLINSVNSKFLIQSIIATGINIVLWLILHLIYNVFNDTEYYVDGSTNILAPLMESSTVLVAVLFSIIPFIVEIIFYILFVSSVKCYDSESNDILRCRNRNTIIFEITIGLIAVFNSHIISTGALLTEASLLPVLIPVAFLIGMIILHLIFISYSLYVPLDKKHNVKDSAKTRLKSITVILLTLILIFSSLLISFSDDIAVKTYSPECKEFTYSEFVDYLNEKGCKAEFDPKIEITDDFICTMKHIELNTCDGFGRSISVSYRTNYSGIAFNEDADDDNSVITLNEGLYGIGEPMEENNYTFYYVIVDNSGTVRVKIDDSILPDLFDVSIIDDKSLEAKIYNTDDVMKICDIIVDITVVLSFVMIVAIIVIYVIKIRKISKKA